MPYTATQLTQYYTSLTGVAPDASTSVLFQAYANQNAGGTLSDAQTLANVFNSVGVQATFEVAESTYQFFTGATTSANGLIYLEGTGTGALANANGLTTANYNGTNGSITSPGTGGFNVENRYYNFAFNLASSGAVNATTGQTFAQTYGSQTIAQTIASAYETIVGSSNVGTANANAAIADIQARVNNGGFAGAIARIGGVDAGGATGQNIGLKAAIVGYILEEANKADVGTYAKAIDQFEASVANGNAIYSTNALQTYQTGGAGFNTGVGLTGSATTGAIIALTPGTDTLNNSNGTVAAGNVTFIGQVGGQAAGVGGSSPTLGPSDTLSAVGSNNTLTTTVVGAGGTQDATGGALITGVQTINVRGVTGTANGTATLAQSTVVGSTTLNNYLSANNNVTFTGVSGSTTVGVIGNGTVSNSVTDAQFISGTTANIALSGGLINTAALGTDTVTIRSAGGTAAGTVNVTSSNGANRIGNLNLVSINTTALNITANSAYRDTNLTDAGGALTTITATGAGSVNVGSATGVATITSVNALNNAGGFTGSFTTATPNGQFSAVSGSGVDSITVDNATATTSVNTSGGGDTITVTGNVTAGTTLNGGGAATLGVTAAQFQTISGGAFGTAAQLAQITGFSTVALNTALTAGTTYDVNSIGAQNFRTIGVTGGGANTANLNAASGAIVTFSDTTTQGTLASANGATSGNFGTLNISEANALTNTADTLNLRFQIGSNSLTFANPTVNSTANVVAQGIETVNIAVTPNAATGLGTETLTLGLTDVVAQTINITGSEGFTFTAANTFAQLRTVNASASTGTATIDVSALNTATATAQLAVTTGAGNDVITVKDFTTVNTGGTTANAATATAGFDTVNVGVTSSGQTYSSITNATAGLHVQFGGETAFAPAKITLASTAVFQDFLDAATSATTANGTVSAFDFAGNTYLVEQNGGGNTFSNGVDSVIQLVGIHTISASSTAATVILGS